MPLTIVNIFKPHGRFYEGVVGGVNLLPVLETLEAKVTVETAVMGTMTLLIVDSPAGCGK